MFFHVEREDTLILEPEHLQKEINELIWKQLRAAVQGKFTARYGYTVVVTRLLSFEFGRIHEDTGSCHFLVRYTSIVFRPIKDQILHAIVTSVTANGFHCKAGPVEIFVSSNPEVMPEDLHFEQPPDGQACWIADEDGTRIEKDSKVRVKLLAVHNIGHGLTAVGTIKDDYLG